MARKRPKGVLAMGWAAIGAAATGRTEHAPTSADYPEHVVRRTSFEAGGGHGWRISAIETPRAGALVAALRAEGIYTDARGSRLRLGPAPYVTDDELDLGVAAVARLITAA